MLTDLGSPRSALECKKPVNTTQTSSITQADRHAQKTFKLREEIVQGACGMMHYRRVKRPELRKESYADEE